MTDILSSVFDSESTFSEMSISLEDFPGNNDIPEGTLRSLVTRTTEPARLKELVRNLGVVEGPRLGISVHVNHLTGDVTGSALQFIGAPEDVLIVSKVPARQLWDGVDRHLNLTITVRVRKLEIDQYEIIFPDGVM